jgi:hypothetical protein
MASAASTTGYGLPIRRLEDCPEVQSANTRTTSWTWRAIADIASGIAFCGVLAWEVWRIGGHLSQLASEVVAAGGGYLF